MAVGSSAVLCRCRAAGAADARARLARLRQGVTESPPVLTVGELPVAEVGSAVAARSAAVEVPGVSACVGPFHCCYSFEVRPAWFPLPGVGRPRCGLASFDPFPLALPINGRLPDPRHSAARSLHRLRLAAVDGGLHGRLLGWPALRRRRLNSRCQRRGVIALALPARWSGHLLPSILSVPGMLGSGPGILLSSVPCTSCVLPLAVAPMGQARSEVAGLRRCIPVRRSAA